MLLLPGCPGLNDDAHLWVVTEQQQWAGQLGEQRSLSGNSPKTSALGKALQGPDPIQC